MDTKNSVVSRGLAVVAITRLALGLNACGNMSRQAKSAALGAGTLGGAGIGALIGNQVEPKR